MTDRENKQSTSDGSFADKTNGRAPGSRGPSQSNRVTIESVRETIGTRQASLLERRTLPQITKQVERKLIVRLSLNYFMRLVLFSVRTNIDSADGAHWRHIIVQRAHIYFRGTGICRKLEGAENLGVTRPPELKTSITP